MLEDGTFYGSIPKFKGVWANVEILSQYQEELQNTLEDGIVLGLHHQHCILPITDIDINLETPEVT
ncbi:type II toxin-antitoxin system HicB family antitoxin [Leptolyngbya sp. FACHB-402]|nr:type II toxin-antitoxin system HicB family antitoxin [Leptolyngbya sp. FACHB-161]MBD2377312.1 type II toxin-antitoxin system HicB family antitoxin [Leptolyngbya sp. FACHB-238]MBD2401477.1 type II toxin-antitoxin system HicB family antitoxin [Leptolyngbya sp. FACHB-239]MBD2408028.1 type II toxin-antitoxin system HicB family antitoxin [Leptolyngbya sp. FACHB-402]